MVAVSFLTPYAALVGLAAVVPLAVLAIAARRSARAAAIVQLEPGPARWLPAAAAIAVTAVVVALAAAQPVVQTESARYVRQDAETYFVLDTSRSMLAAASPAEETRFERAQRVARRLREQLGDVPAGVASLTDRVLPHLLPTAERAVFAATVERAVAVGRPPPVDRSTRSTSLGAVAALARHRFFSPRAERRLVIVVSDAESRRFPVDEAVRAFSDGRYLLLLVHIWEEDERVWSSGGPEPYAPDPSAVDVTRRFLAAAGGRIFGESELSDAAAAARRFLGEGPERAQGTERRPVSLAPWVLAAGVLPVGLLLWRRPLEH